MFADYEVVKQLHSGHKSSFNLKVTGGLTVLHKLE